MNESVCSGLCAQLKGSIKGCLWASTVLGRKFASWCTEERAKRKKVARINPYADDTPLDGVQRANRCATSQVARCVRFINVSALTRNGLLARLFLLFQSQVSGEACLLEVRDCNMSRGNSAHEQFRNARISHTKVVL